MRLLICRGASTHRKSSIQQLACSLYQKFLLAYHLESHSLHCKYLHTLWCAFIFSSSSFERYFTYYGVFVHSTHFFGSMLHLWGNQAFCWCLMISKEDLSKIFPPWLSTIWLLIFQHTWEKGCNCQIVRWRTPWDKKSFRLKTKYIRALSPNVWMHWRHFFLEQAYSSVILNLHIVSHSTIML